MFVQNILLILTVFTACAFYMCCRITWSRWEALRRIASLRVTQVVSILPLIAVIIAGAGPFLQNSLMDYVSYDAGPLFLRFLPFYVGALFISAAMLIYAAACPDIIKRYPARIDYVLSQPLNMSLLQDTILHNTQAWPYRGIPHITEHSRLGILKNVTGFPVDQTHMNEYDLVFFQRLHLYDGANTVNPIAANVSLLLFLLGIALVVQSTIYNIIFALYFLTTSAFHSLEIADCAILSLPG